MEYIHGNITNVTSGLIIHGVNCQARMGSGVALAIRNKWPVVYAMYMKRSPGRHNLGHTQFIEIDDGLHVANCWTQEFYGNDGKVYADIHALYRCVLAAFAYCDELNLELNTPKIAAGLAGLNWEKDVVPVFVLGQTLYPNVRVKVFFI